MPVRPLAPAPPTLGAIALLVCVVALMALPGCRGCDKPAPPSQQGPEAARPAPLPGSPTAVAEPELPTPTAEPVPPTATALPGAVTQPVDEGLLSRTDAVRLLGKTRTWLEKQVPLAGRDKQVWARRVRDTWQPDEVEHRAQGLFLADPDGTVLRDGNGCRVLVRGQPTLRSSSERAAPAEIAAQCEQAIDDALGVLSALAGLARPERQAPGGWQVEAVAHQGGAGEATIRLANVALRTRATLKVQSDGSLRDLVVGRVRALVEPGGLTLLSDGRPLWLWTVAPDGPAPADRRSAGVWLRLVPGKPETLRQDWDNAALAAGAVRVGPLEVEVASAAGGALTWRAVQARVLGVAGSLKEIGNLQVRGPAPGLRPLPDGVHVTLAAEAMKRLPEWLAATPACALLRLHGPPPGAPAGQDAPEVLEILCCQAEPPPRD